MSKFTFIKIYIVLDLNYFILEGFTQKCNKNEKDVKSSE